jgi:hypothetical protein
VSHELEKWFPGLAQAVWEECSPESPRYNCIAWAAGDDTKRWDPSFLPKKKPAYYWPSNASKGLGIADLVSAFQSIGYTECDDGAQEHGFDKVVLYK